jgi:hypothetical protein
MLIKRLKEILEDENNVIKKYSFECGRIKDNDHLTYIMHPMNNRINELTLNIVNYKDGEMEIIFKVHNNENLNNLIQIIENKSHQHSK